MLVDSRAVAESYKDIETDLRVHLMSQKSLLIDFQGEMMGHAGEIYFAAISPTDFLISDADCREAAGAAFSGDTIDSAASSIDTIATAATDCTAPPGPTTSHVVEFAGFILDMQSQARVCHVTRRTVLGSLKVT